MRYIFAIIGIVLADQGCKALVLQHYGIGGGAEIINGFMSVACIQNNGIAFGFFADHVNLILCITSLILGGILVYLFLNAGSQLTCIALAFIAGGGVGNMIDRLRLGYVVDFIDLRIWPNIFNIADLFVVLGCILIIVSMVASLKGKA